MWTCPWLSRHTNINISTKKLLSSWFQSGPQLQFHLLVCRKGRKWLQSHPLTHTYALCFKLIYIFACLTRLSVFSVAVVVEIIYKSTRGLNIMDFIRKHIDAYTYFPPHSNVRLPAMLPAERSLGNSSGLSPQKWTGLNNSNPSTQLKQKCTKSGIKSFWERD